MKLALQMRVAKHANPTIAPFEAYAAVASADRLDGGWWSGRDLPTTSAWIAALSNEYGPIDRGFRIALQPVSEPQAKARLAPCPGSASPPYMVPASPGGL